MHELYVCKRSGLQTNEIEVRSLPFFPPYSISSQENYKNVAEAKYCNSGFFSFKMYTIGVLVRESENNS